MGQVTGVQRPLWGVGSRTDEMAEEHTRSELTQAGGGGHTSFSGQALEQVLTTDTERDKSEIPRRVLSAVTGNGLPEGRGDSDQQSHD